MPFSELFLSVGEKLGRLADWRFCFKQHHVIFFRQRLAASTSCRFDAVFFANDVLFMAQEQPGLQKMQQFGLADRVNVRALCQFIERVNRCSTG